MTNRVFFPRTGDGIECRKLSGNMSDEDFEIKCFSSRFIIYGVSAYEASYTHVKFDHEIFDSFFIFFIYTRVYCVIL